MKIKKKTFLQFCAKVLDHLQPPWFFFMVFFFLCSVTINIMPAIIMHHFLNNTAENGTKYR